MNDEYIVTKENYYDAETDKRFMSVHAIKEYVKNTGTIPNNFNCDKIASQLKGNKYVSMFPLWR